MRFFVLAIASLLTFTTLSAAQATSDTQLIPLPGTGIRIVPPKGIKLAPVGSMLFDESLQTSFVFMMGEEKRNSESDPNWRLVYKSQPEHVSMNSLSGKLYRHTRVIDGGNYDSWCLLISRDGRTLSATAYYNGPSTEFFESLRKSLLTISWDRSMADPELAAGIRLNPPTGLQLIKGEFGGISFNRTGTIGDNETSLTVFPMPFPRAKADALFPALCQRTLGSALGGKTFVGSGVQELGRFRYCDATSNTWDRGFTFAALLLFPNHGVVSVVGSTSPDRLKEGAASYRAALRTAIPLRQMDIH